MRSKKNDYSSSIQGSLFSRPVKKYSQPNSVLNSHRYNDASGFSSQVGIDMQNAVHGRAPDIDQMPLLSSLLAATSFSLPIDSISRHLPDVQPTRIPLLDGLCEWGAGAY